MFGALNKFISKLGDEPQEQAPETSGACGFQVLSNRSGRIPLEPWFDFIVGINGRSIESADPNLFVTEVRNCAGATISLGVWSGKGQKIHEIFVTIPAESPSLGVSLQWMPLSTAEHVWHILEVAPNSPADIAGLLPYGDYVIGSPDIALHGESSLGQFIEQNIDHPINLFVYNHEYNVTRPVEMTPSRNWGGHGALGCTLGFGALHKIPASLEEPPSAPGDTIFTSSSSFDEKRPFSAAPAPSLTVSDAEALGGDFIVPANLSLPPPPKPGTPVLSPGAGKRTKARAHHTIGAGSNNLDSFFEEGEKASREADFAPKATTGGPPPPRAGGSPSVVSATD